MATATELSYLRQDEFLGELDMLLAIYADAMDADNALLPGRIELMRRHASYPSFQALHVRAEIAGTASVTWPVVGFAYGFRGQAGQWWYDAVWSVLSRAVGTAQSASWMSDSLEIAEVHVNQRHQRSGIGTGMLMALTHGRTEQTAMLSTPDKDTTARRLYRRMGFRDLVTGYSFPGGSPPYAVMGAALPLRDAAAAAATRDRSASPSIW